MARWRGRMEVGGAGGREGGRAGEDAKHGASIL